MITCPGCGSPIQSSDPEAPGYVPASALRQEKVLCRRCFRMKHYNEASSVTLDPDDFLQILNQIGRTRCLVVHIVDLFDFEGSVITGLPRFAGNNPVLLAVNKMDLLPRSTNPNKVLHWARKQLKAMGLKVADAVPVSAKKNIGIESLAGRIEEIREGRDVYVVGATNTGKSTLINRLIRNFSDLDAELTTSRYPGTTLNMVRIPLEDGRFIIDTPGIVYDDRLTEMIDKKDLRTVMPEETLKPRVFQLNSGQTLFFGALARMDFLQGERQSFTCYVSNDLTGSPDEAGASR